MIRVIDKNETLKPPAGFMFQYLTAEGMYLRLRYKKTETRDEFTHTTNEEIYLNSDGREVVRTVDVVVTPIFKPEPPPTPLTFWQKVWEFFKMQNDGYF